MVGGGRAPIRNFFRIRKICECFTAKEEATNKGKE